jgi:hypothetical protein
MFKLLINAAGNLLVLYFISIGVLCMYLFSWRRQVKTRRKSTALPCSTRCAALLLDWFILFPVGGSTAEFLKNIIKYGVLCLLFL